MNGSWFGWFSGLVVMVGCGACQVTPLRDAFTREAPVQIVGITLSGESDLEVRVAFSQPVQATLLFAWDAQAPHQPATSLVGAPGETVTWMDKGGAAFPGVRYFKLRVTTGSGDWFGDEWAVFVHPRESGQRYLVSVPVEFGGEGTLAGALGEQAAVGLHPGSTTNDADSLELFTPQGTWQPVYLLAGPPPAAATKAPDGEVSAPATSVPFWWDPATGLPAVRAIAPGEAFWVVRGSGDRYRTSRGVWSGPCYTAAHGIPIRLSASGGTPFGLPLSRPLVHRAGQAPDALGFIAAGGSGGTTSDPTRADEGGDQIWAWSNNEWQGHYWLMDHIRPDRDGFWWDDRTREIADFVLQPGVGYYYRHRPNRWGGKDFTWTPIRAENVDN